MRRPERHSFGWRLADAVCVDPAFVHLVWPKVSHWIKAALERGDMGTFSSVEVDVLNARALLWVVWNEPDLEGAAVTQVENTESSKVCTIVAFGGLRKSVHLLAKLEDYARQQGCTVSRIVGRYGWQRILPDYRTAKVILEKRLT